MITKQGMVFPHPTKTDIVPLIYLGFISTGIGNHLYFTYMKHLKAKIIAVFGYLEPVCAVVLSAVLLHESMTFLQILGAICIIGGAMFCELHSFIL